MKYVSENNLNRFLTKLKGLFAKKSEVPSQADVDAKLPLAGGTMTGGVAFPNGKGIVSNSKNLLKRADQYIQIGDTSWSGSAIELCAPYGLTVRESNSSSGMVLSTLNTSANPTLAGTEAALEGLKINGTSYKVPDMSNPMAAQGDIIYGGSSGAPTRLAKGSAEQVLKMNSGGTAPEWGNIPTSLNSRSAQSIPGDEQFRFVNEFIDTNGTVYHNSNWYMLYVLYNQSADIYFISSTFDGSAPITKPGITIFNALFGGLAPYLVDLVHVDAGGGASIYMLDTVNLVDNGVIRFYNEQKTRAGIWTIDDSSPVVVTYQSDVITPGMRNPMSSNGDIIYGGSSGTPTRLAKGTSGYLLRSTGGAPEWTNQIPILTSNPATDPQIPNGQIVICKLQSEPLDKWDNILYIIAPLPPE